VRLSPPPFLCKLILRSENGQRIWLLCGAKMFLDLLKFCIRPAPSLCWRRHHSSWRCGSECSVQSVNLCASMSTKGSVSYHSCLAVVCTSDAGDNPLQLWVSHFFFSLQLCQFLPYNYFGFVVRFIFLSKCYIFMVYWSFYHLPPVIFSLLPTKYFFSRLFLLITE
jgi:hypothetical protein